MSSKPIRHFLPFRVEPLCVRCRKINKAIAILSKNPTQLHITLLAPNRHYTFISRHRPFGSPPFRFLERYHFNVTTLKRLP